MEPLGLWVLGFRGLFKGLEGLGFQVRVYLDPLQERWHNGLFEHV